MKALTQRLIAVEGPIGVGKTTLARKLAERQNARLVLEDADGNPFLEDFYKTGRKNALQTQLHFLLARSRNLASLAQLDLFQQGVVMDYTLEKDALFARLNLSPSEMELYHQISKALIQVAGVPDLVIYLQASVDTLLQRIEKRGRESERKFSRSYLQAVSSAYSETFFHYRQGPLLMVNTEQLDLETNEKDVELLARKIDTVTAGVHSFSPQGSAAFELDFSS